MIIPNSILSGKKIPNAKSTWLLRTLRRRQYFQSSIFISYSKLLLQIFQTNMKKYIQNIKMITRWCYTSAGKSEWSYCAPPSKVLIQKTTGWVSTRDQNIILCFFVLLNAEGCRKNFQEQYVVIFKFYLIILHPSAERKRKIGLN